MTKENMTFEKLLTSYFNIRPRKRRIFVGWCVLIIMLFIVFFGGYCIYQGGKAIKHLCSTEEYSNKGSHRDFVVIEKNPKRHVQLSKDFNDLNDVHLSAAQKLGIKPLDSRDELDSVKTQLVKLHDTKYYIVDKLTHSVPYLVPDAADFLTALGKLLQEYNATDSRFIITSVLRTDGDVKRLSHGNVNASKNSAHLYATTIDITYNRFDCHGTTNEIQLKADLARALYDMRKAGHCYVKYEYKQACFHITVRPK